MLFVAIWKLCIQKWLIMHVYRPPMFKFEGKLLWVDDLVTWWQSVIN